MHDSMAKLDGIAAKAIEMMADMITIFKAAAEQLAIGQALDKVPIDAHQLYLANAKEFGWDMVAVCSLLKECDVAVACAADEDVSRADL